jgi:hypothetical protein
LVPEHFKSLCRKLLDGERKNERKNRLRNKETDEQNNEIGERLKRG